MAVDIPAKLVMELRGETGAPMMDAKRALQESNGDMEEAKRWLRERGMAQAAKRADRETKEGLVGYRIAGKKGTIVAVGCETEPVSKNDEFQSFAKTVLDTVDARGVGAESQLDEARTALTAKLGENIVVVGSAQFTAGDDEMVTGYAHPPANKLGVLVLMRGPGPLRHRIVIAALRVRGPTLELALRNAGNVSERIAPIVQLYRRGRLVGRMQASPRELLPRSRGICAFRFRGRVNGRVAARVRVAAVTRVFRLELD